MQTYQPVHLLVCECLSMKLLSYMKSSAAVLRWNQDFSSLGMDESVSFPFANSTFPRCRIAATTRNIASWNGVKNKEKQDFQVAVILEGSYLPTEPISYEIPAHQHLFQQLPLPSLLRYIPLIHQVHPTHSNLIDSDNEMF